MTTESLLRQTRLLVAAIAISALSLGAIVGFGWSQRSASHRDHTIIVGVRDNSVQTKQTAARQECIRKRSSALDDARWSIVFSLLGRADVTPVEAVKAGLQGETLPDIDTLANKGGTIVSTKQGATTAHRYAACPLPITMRKPTPTTTTTGTVKP